jgi:hypothetical protein
MSHPFFVVKTVVILWPFKNVFLNNPSQKSLDNE